MIKNVLVNKFFFCLMLLFAITSVNAQSDASSRYASNSVLSQGNWYKIQIPSTGVYKLTYEDLKKMGLSDPRKVQIYGYGGEVLAEDFSKTYVDDLPQVAIWMSKSPSEFGAGDFLLFYAKGDIKWEYNDVTKEFVHKQHPYSGNSYYFVTESNDGPKLMGTTESLSSSSVVATSFDDYFLHEQDLVNLAESGREFYGENFKTTSSRNFNIALPGITSERATFRIEFVSNVPSTRPAGSLSVSLNNSLLKKFAAPQTSDKYAKAVAFNDSVQRSNILENNILNLSYAQGSSSDNNVHLNYIRVNYNRALKPYGAVTLFRSKTRSSRLGFKVSEASPNILVFDVTESVTPEKMAAQLSGSELVFTASNLIPREYAMVDVSKSIPSPTLVGKIKNQNLHALASKEMIIIVQPNLEKYAKELAQIHLDDSGLGSAIVNPDDIYNEFSSGKPDATAYRRFAKMFYDRAENDAERPQYLLLFGDGTYDNRFILSQNNWTESDKKSILLTYQSENSLVETSTYVSDDYFGFLDDKEGVSLGSDVLDLGIGRIPVRTDREAVDVISKIKTYIANKDKNIWKNNIAFVADDAVAASNSISLERDHMKNSEALAVSIKRNYPHIIVNKIYEDAYERLTISGAGRYPDVKKEISHKLQSGLLVLNYVGHGSSNDWAHEYIMTNADIDLMNNTRLPLWITASCDYSKFDANVTSGGEYALLNAKGGAIALISASRVVYSNGNNKLHEKITNRIFEKQNGKPARLGDIIRHAKNEVTGDTNKLRFLLLGDPALRLSYPDDTYKVKVTEVTGSDVDNDIQLKALSKTVIKGEIVDIDGNRVEDFNGFLESVIFDGEQTLKTRGNLAGGVTGDASVMMDYTDFTNTIYSGKVNIENGVFNIEFTVPKDILYLNANGKMSFYAYDLDNEKEALGSFTNYLVGGTDENAVEDNTPPEIIRMYLNKEDFRSGDNTNSTPFFVAEVKDAHSDINLSSGIGHNISLLIDGLKSYNVTPYFAGSGTSSSSGFVRFSIPELEEGRHSLQFKVWDVWNNSATQSLDFEVVNNYKPTMYKFILEGNPAKESVRFKLLSDLAGSVVNVKFEVFSMTGALQWSYQTQGSPDTMSYYTEDWNLITANGRRLTPGIYICRATISIDGSVKATKSEKLIVVQ